MLPQSDIYDVLNPVKLWVKRKAESGLDVWAVLQHFAMILFYILLFFIAYIKYVYIYVYIPSVLN